MEAVRQNWAGPAAPGVRLLPRLLHADQLPKGGEFPERGIAIGIDETALEPVFVDFDSDPFLLVFGESESGKTNLLRLIAKQIAERYTPDQARLVVGDYRRTLLGALPEEHLLEYAPMANSLQMHMEALGGVFSRRQPPPDVTPQQLRDRSWWTGPDVFIIIDDFDLVATSQGNPLAPLVEYLLRPGHGRALHHRAEHGGRLALDVRVVHAADQGAGRAGPGPVGRPGRGRPGGYGASAPDAAGPGLLRLAQAGHVAGAARPDAGRHVIGGNPSRPGALPR